MSFALLLWILNDYLETVAFDDCRQIQRMISHHLDPGTERSKLLTCGRMTLLFIFAGYLTFQRRG